MMIETNLRASMLHALAWKALVLKDLLRSADPLTAAKKRGFREKMVAHETRDT